MNRKDTTRFLTDMLTNNLCSSRKYYAKEVTLDYGTLHPKRVDVMAFEPKSVLFTSDIEKGMFSCYEVKSCIQDVYSGNGLNFYGEKNYIVTTMETYKELQNDMRSGKLENHICDFMGVTTCPHYGVIVPVPSSVDLRSDARFSEYEAPTKLSDSIIWKFWNIYPQSREWHRTRSMNELLFCMLRAKHNYSNREVNE